MTAEVYMHGSDGMTNIETFDPEQRMAKRERRRKKYGYHAIGCGHTKTPRVIRAIARIGGGGKATCGHKV